MMATGGPLAALARLNGRLRTQPGGALHLAPEQQPSAAGWIPSLDGLRAVSITLVMVGHLISGHLAPGGFGVSVFFVISGFLITRLLLAEGKRDGTLRLPRFYARRMLRLYPPVLAYVAVTLTAFLIIGKAFDWREVWAVLLYFANYWYAAVLPPGAGTLPYSIFWSLAVEEHFYLLLPPLLVLLHRRPGRLIWAMAAVCVGELALRLAAVALDPGLIAREAPYYLTHFRLDSLAYGVVLAGLCELEWGRRLIARLGHPAVFAGALALLLFTFVLRDPAFRQTWRYSLQGLALLAVFCALLFSRRYRPIQAVLNLGVAQWVGRLSYSLYIWHVPSPDVARWLTPHASRGVLVAESFIAAFVMAALSYYGVERTVRSLRGRFGATLRGRRAPAPAGGPALG